MPRVFLSLFAGLTCLLIGIFVYRQNRKQSININFLLLNLSLFFWNSSDFLWPVLNTLKMPLVSYYRLSYIGGTLLILFFIQLIHSLVIAEKQKPIERIFRFLLYAVSFYLILIAPSDQIIKDVKFGVTYQEIPGPSYNLFALYFFIGFIYALWLLFKGIRETRNIRKKQLNYFLLGLSLGLICAVISFISILRGFDISYIIFYSFEVGYISITAYAITRYRLMDIKVILERSLIYAISTIITAGIFVLILLSSEFILKVGINNIYVMTLAAAAMVFSFKPIEELTKKGVIRLFFSQKYKLEQIANKFSDGISRFMKRNEFGEYVTRSATSVFKLNGGASFIYNKKNNQFECADGRGTLGFLKGNIIDQDNPLIKEMMGQNKSILREDFEFALAQKKGIENIKEIASAFSKLKSHICVPSISNLEKGQMLGFFLGDEKKSGEPYSQEDIVLLEIFGNQAAASIDNVLLYENQVETLKSSMELEKFASLGETTATVAHEIKNALSYVVTFPQVLEKRKDDKAFLEKAPDIFLHEVDRIDLVMQGIVNYAKPSPLKIEKINLKVLIEETLVLIKSKAKNNRVEIEFICDDNLFIEADWNKLKQVFLNLFLNALDAMVLGGRLKIEAAKDNSFVIIKTEDTGVGIPKDKVETIFEAFYTTKENGTGLGLAIVKQIVEQNKGTVSVDSVEGKGTVFNLKFQLI